MYPIIAADIGLSFQVQCFPSYQAPRLSSVLTLLQSQREVSSFAECLKKVNKTINEFGFRMIS